MLDFSLFINLLNNELILKVSSPKLTNEDFYFKYHDEFMDLNIHDAF